jgi:hypothetical protein
MALYPGRFRVMNLSECGQQNQQFDRYDDRDDLDGARALREQFVVTLRVTGQDFAELMKWFMGNLRRMRREIDWLERQSSMIWTPLEDEYFAWPQIACDGRAAGQDWRAPGWLDRWPEEVPWKDLLVAARGRRLSSERTAVVLKVVAERIRGSTESGRGHPGCDLILRG